MPENTYGSYSTYAMFPLIFSSPVYEGISLSIDNNIEVFPDPTFPIIKTNYPEPNSLEISRLISIKTGYLFSYWDLDQYAVKFLNSTEEG